MKKKNFTLVEIMIVVAIIAILAAIAVPALAANRRSANLRAAESNVKMVEAAVNSYLADNPTVASSTAVGWADIAPYMKDVTDQNDLMVAGETPTLGVINSANTITYVTANF